MRKIITLLCMSFFLFLPNAHAESVGVFSGDVCTSFGSTQMDSDGKNIVACLWNNNKTGYVWKSMTGGTATLPAGTVAYFALSSCPTGWLEAKGQSTSGYSALATAIGAVVPDLRGYFLRAWDHGRGVDSGRKLKSAQKDALQGHWHARFTYRFAYIDGSKTGVFDHNGINTNRTEITRLDTIRDPVTDKVHGEPRIADETRPKNIALLACISTGE